MGRRVYFSAMDSPVSSATVRCPRCNTAAAGHFCSNCGAALGSSACPACSRPLPPNGRFCHHCGTAVGLEGAAVATAARFSIAWLVPAIAVLLLVTFLIGQRLGHAGTAATDPVASTSGMTSAAPADGRGPRAPDISSMSPEDRAAKLFDLIMRLGQEGKQDSVRFFAPMAIRAYEMIGPPDLHIRYDEGMIAVIAGDANFAKAEADTILAHAPTHLLGLILAIKAAGLRQDMTARTQFVKTFLAAVPAERMKKLKEYADHKNDIDAELTAARGAKP